MNHVEESVLKALGWELDFNTMGKLIGMSSKIHGRFDKYIYQARTITCTTNNGDIWEVSFDTENKILSISSRIHGVFTDAMIFPDETYSFFYQTEEPSGSFKKRLTLYASGDGTNSSYIIRRNLRENHFDGVWTMIDNGSGLVVIPGV
jgi:hypothetical protein